MKDENLISPTLSLSLSLIAPTPLFFYLSPYPVRFNPVSHGRYMGSCSLCLTLFQRDIPQRDPMDSVAHTHGARKHTLLQGNTRLHKYTYAYIGYTHFHHCECVDRNKFKVRVLWTTGETPFKIHYTAHYAVHYAAFKQHIHILWLCLWGMKWNTFPVTINVTTNSQSCEIILL